VKFAAILTVCTALLIAPAPAMAQDDFERMTRNDDMQTGSRFKRTSQSPDEATQRYMQKRVAKCVVYGEKDLARDLVAKSDTARIDYEALGVAPNNLFKELDVANCLGRAAKSGTLSIAMRIPPRTLRNLMAEEVYLMDQKDPLVIADDAPASLPNRFYTSGNTRGAKMTAELSDCIVHHSPDAAHEFIETRPGTSGEADALDGLYEALTKCAGEGIAEADIDMSSMRMVVADGLWARMHYGPTANAENSEAAE